MGSSRPATGCTVVNTDKCPGCSVKGKTIAKKVLAVVFFIYLCHCEKGFARRSNLEFTLEL
jgi:hypothetical protein